MIEVVQFQDDHAADWDDFVLQQSANGTLFHTRKFLSYHLDRSFDDHSILIYQSGKLIAVLAAALLESGEFFSHPGTSCGGPVIHQSYFKIAEIVKISDAITEQYNGRLGMRLCESFLAPSSNAPLLYHFSKSCDVRFELSAYKELSCTELVNSISQSRTRSTVRNIFREHDDFEVASSEESYRNFHSLLVRNLRQHDTTPVHSEDELLKLARLLGRRQALVIWRDAMGAMAAGVWMIRASQQTWHAQYICKHDECNVNGVVEATLLRAMGIAQENNARYFSLGISTEDRGARLNLGLSTFKEKLGCAFENRYLLTPFVRTTASDQ